MKITIDARPAMLQRTGIGHYTYNLLKEFVRLAPQNDYYLSDIFAGMGFYNMYRVKPGLAGADRFLNIFRIPFPFVTLSRFMLLCWCRLRGDTSRVEDTDLFFGTNFRAVFAEGLKTVITIHDMAHEYFPDTIRDAETYAFLKHELPDMARRADRIIAVSETTRCDIIRFLGIEPEKITVVHNGVDAMFRPVTDRAWLDAVRAHYRLPERFILFVGAIQPRKNLPALLEAYASVCSGGGIPEDLVIAGGEGWKSEGLVPLIENLGIGGKVHFTGYIKAADLPPLYSMAELFAFPSLYEGFGLPVLEAMACGVPVVTSNSSSLREIAGDAAVLVDPGSPASIADGLRHALTDQALRNECRVKGLERARLFTWEECANQTLEVFRAVKEGT